MEYRIYRSHSCQNSGELFSIDCYPWGKQYTPKTTGSLILIENEEMCIRDSLSHLLFKGYHVLLLLLVGVRGLANLLR